jgi:hypothetical protein
MMGRGGTAISRVARAPAAWVYFAQNSDPLTRFIGAGAHARRCGTFSGEPALGRPHGQKREMTKRHGRSELLRSSPNRSSLPHSERLRKHATNIRYSQSFIFRSN